MNGDGTDGCGDAVKAAWILVTRPSFTSTPESTRSSCQRPGVLEMSVSPFAPCRKSAAMRLRAVPGPAKPESMMDAPSGMSATAASKSG